MNKKYSLIINVVMVVVGIAGMLFFFIANKKTINPSEKQTHSQLSGAKTATENITVVVASKGLTKGTILSSGDYELKTLAVPLNSSDKERFLVGHPVDNWLVNSDVAKGTYVPAYTLVEPGSAEYIRLSMKQGSIIYRFSVKKTDSYLFDNIHAGDNVDVYLSYGLRKSEDAVIPTINTADIDNRHFKLLLKEKKVLSINEIVSLKNKISDSTMSNVSSREGGYILIELNDRELKTVKGLDDAKLYVFPSEKDPRNINEQHSVLSGDERQWPVDNSNILSVKVKDNSEPESEVAKEYRGDK